MTAQKPQIVKVEGVENLRDLGGYPAQNGDIIASGKFFRGAALHHITSQGMDRLNQLGIHTIIDLRSQAEVEQAPPKLSGLEASYHHLPMLDHLNSAIAAGEWSFPESMLDMYQQLLRKYQPEFREMFSIFEASEGGVLFHCTMGKDRTGVSAMLLYGLAGVNNEIISTDYGWSEKILGIQTDLPPEIPEYAVRTKPEYMRDTIAWLEETYGGIPDYLTAIGVSDKTKQAVQQQLGVTLSI